MTGLTHGRQLSHDWLPLRAHTSVFHTYLAHTPPSGSKLAAPDHSRIRSVCRRYKELVRVLRELDGSCMAKLRQVYSQAVNMLIRYGYVYMNAAMNRAGIFVWIAFDADDDALLRPRVLLEKK